MDMVGHTAAAVTPKLRTAAPMLRVFDDVIERLKGTPRYLLDDAATRTCVELNLGRPKVLFEAMRHLRIPFPRMWIEWDDAARQQLRERFHEELSFKELRPMPGRVGFLLECDEHGRKGRATWLWSTPGDNDDVPNVGAIEPYFDLDRQFPLPPDRVEGMMKGNLARLWLDNPIQLEALWDIWRTADHRPSDWGERYLRELNSPLMTALAYADVFGEYCFIWAALILLTASRPIVDLVPVDLGKVNRLRRLRKKVPLLDHTKVTMHLREPEMRYNPIVRGPLGHARKSPRVHLVSSYLARRGDKHWICQPYMRGSGDLIHRRVHVKG